MKIFRIIILFSLSFLSVLSVQADEKKEFPNFKAPLSENYSTALYQGKISFGKRKLSGLFVFKYDKSNEVYNIVVMSELGMSLLKYKCENNKIELLESAPFFQNKKMKKLIAKYFMILVQNLSENTTKIKKKKEGWLVKTHLKKTTGVKGKVFYYYKNNGALTRIYTKEMLPLHFAIEEGTPINRKIDFSQRLLGLSINLKLLKID